MKTLFAVVVLAVVSAAQSAPPSNNAVSMPSKAEIGELLSKADQKVSGFEETVKLVRPQLDRIDPKVVANYLDAASTAHNIIDTMQKTGASGYGLVGLLGTLDDLSLDAANASVLLLKAYAEASTQGKQPSVAGLASVVAVSNAGTGVNDISELIMHATLRFVGAEEQALDKFLEKPTEKCSAK